MSIVASRDHSLNARGSGSVLCRSLRYRPCPAGNSVRSVQALGAMRPRTSPPTHRGPPQHCARRNVGAAGGCLAPSAPGRRCHSLASLSSLRARLASPRPGSADTRPPDCPAPSRPPRAGPDRISMSQPGPARTLGRSRRRRERPPRSESAFGHRKSSEPHQGAAPQRRAPSRPPRHPCAPRPLPLRRGWRNRRASHP
jgi:hypothetical protein